MTRLFLLILLVVPLIAGAEIYKSVDEHGNTVYSDTPPASGSSAEKIQIGTTNSSPPPRHVERPEPVTKEVKPEFKVDITSPANDDTIAIGYMGNFVVEASVNPPLSGGNMAQLLMDGEAVGPPQGGTSWALSNTFRGSHILTVVISTPSGDTLATSSPVTVHVLRTSIRR